jgi:hypothetical protein
VEDREMPLESYAKIHAEANLSVEDKEVLIAWVKTL